MHEFVFYFCFFRFSSVNNNTTKTVTENYTTVYWDFDGNGNDLYGPYNGVLENGAQFSNRTYFGSGYDLQLNASFNQSFLISSPFLNLSYTSFTVEAWIFGNTLTGDNAIFGQCSCSSCQDQCLYLMVRNSKLYMGFMLDDIVGLTSLTINTWFHVAYVYDYSSRTQMLYLQGILDNSRSSSGPYRGGNASTMIGASALSGSSFNGYIDNVKVTTRAKTADELLTAATLVVHFSFDGPTLADDMGPNKMNATLSNVAGVPGKVGQGLGFNAVMSYMQMPGFYQLGQSNRPFSYAMWVYPYSVVGGTLLLKTAWQTSNTTWCQIMMGLTYTGQIAFRTNGMLPQMTGPFIPAMQWTHLALTYGTTNGQIMYINGVMYMTTGPGSWTSSNQIDWLTIGFNFGSCTASPIIGGFYFGIVDEFYVYRRELSATEVYALANP